MALISFHPMNTKALLKTGILLFILCNTLWLEAEVTFIGNDWDTDARWRNPSVIKPNDIDKDNVYGTSGYYLASGLRAGYKDPFLGDNQISGDSNPDDINELPDFITSLEFSDPTELGRSWGGSGANFGRIDPISGSTGLTGAAILKRGEVTAPLSLTLKRSDSPAFRLTLIIGNNPNEAGFDDPEGQLVTIDDGDDSISEVSGDFDLFPSAGYTTYQTWEISAGSSDITLELIGMPDGVGIARLSGIAIDIDETVAPEIIKQPSGGTFLADTDITLSVIAGGTNPEFQWFKNDQPIPGATSNILSIDNASTDDAGNYSVSVENSAGSVESEKVQITIAENLPAQLVNFQDQISEEPSLISNYTFDEASLRDSIDSNDGESVGNVEFVEGLGGGAAKALGLDGSGHVNLGDPQNLDFFDLSGTVQVWLRADWTSSPGYNPCIIADRNGEEVNYSLHLTANKDQIVFWNGSRAAVVDIPAAGLDWHLFSAVFEESNFRLYWDGKEVHSSEIELGPIAEAPTQIGSSSPGGAELWIGAIDEVSFFEDPLMEETIRSHYLAFLAGELPIIRSQPSGGKFLVGKPLEISIEADGNGLDYQWYKNQESIAGAESSSLEIASLSLDDQGTYYVTVSNPSGSVQSVDVEVEIFESLAPNLVEFQDSVLDQLGLISYYTFEDANADDNQGLYDGNVIGKASFEEGVGGGAAKSLVTNGAGHLTLGAIDDFDFFNGNGTVQLWIRADWTTAPGYNPCIFSDREGGPVNYSIHMNQDKNGILFWNGSSVSSISIPDAGLDWHLFTVVFDQGTWSVYWDGQLSATQDHEKGLSFEVTTHIGSSSTGGAEIWPGAFDEVAFFDDALTAEDIESMYGSFASGTPPEILESPQNSRLFAGSDLELSVAVRGADLSYQWFKNGEPLENETEQSIAFLDVSQEDSGSYHVIVSNSSGQVTSDPAIVEVVSPNLSAYQDIINSEQSLLSYYTFDDQNVEDTVGINDGFINGSIDYQTGVGGSGDNSIILDGQSHVSLDFVEDFDFADGTGTVEAWVRSDWIGSPGYNPCIFADRDGGPVRWSIHMNINKGAYGLWNGASYSPQAISGADGTWRHLAVVFTGTETQFYWDGILAGSTSQVLTGPAGPTQLGSSSSLATTEGWVGALDEVAFYSDPIPPESIQAHYEALAGPLTGTGPAINLISDDGSLSILFEGGQLQQSSSVNGPWEDVTDATSPYSLPTTETQQFYRIN